MPPDVVHGRHVYFAVGNIDFAEDIPDSKHTLHATAMAIYQQCKPTDVTSCQDLVIARNPQFITCSVIGHLTVDNGGPVVHVFHKRQAIGSSLSHS